MSYKSAIGLMAVVLFLAASAIGSASQLDPKAVGDGLLCQCGCNIQVSQHCQHAGCSFHTDMRALIVKEIAAGKDELAIRQDFVHLYGIQVLATPPAHGFYLTVWILPALCVPLGLALVIVVVRRWRKPRAEIAGPRSEPIDPRAMAAMEEEMKRVAG